MPNQESIYVMPPLAVEGSLGSAVLPAELIPGARAVGNVMAGRWVWGAIAPTGAALERTVQQFVANTGTGKPLGLAYRVKVGTLPCDQAAFNGYLSGHPVPVLTGEKGESAWVKTTTAATIGQKAFAVLADGTTATGAAGATVTGAVETDFKVVAFQNDGSVGDLILIVKA